MMVKLNDDDGVRELLDWHFDFVPSRYQEMGVYESKYNICRNFMGIWNACKVGDSIDADLFEELTHSHIDAVRRSEKKIQERYKAEHDKRKYIERASLVKTETT